MTSNKAYKGILIFLIAVLVALMLLGACGGVETERATDPTSNFEYEKLVIEGMPCILIDKGGPGLSYGKEALTCNWSYWTGSISNW